MEKLLLPEEGGGGGGRAPREANGVAYVKGLEIRGSEGFSLARNDTRENNNSLPSEDGNSLGRWAGCIHARVRTTKDEARRLNTAKVDVSAA